MFFFRPSVDPIKIFSLKIAQAESFLFSFHLKRLFHLIQFESLRYSSCQLCLRCFFSSLHLNASMSFKDFSNQRLIISNCISNNAFPNFKWVNAWCDFLSSFLLAHKTCCKKSFSFPLNFHIFFPPSTNVDKSFWKYFNFTNWMPLRTSENKR